MAEEFISNVIFDLNELPVEASMEEGFTESGAIVVASGEYPLDDRVDIEDYEDEKSTNVFEPFVGQCFLSEEEAFIFYKNYANRHGFSIRKGRFVTKNGEITFTCLMKKPPKTILTNQDPWMTEAISKELSLTKHAFCIWHITAKFSGWFTATLQNQYSNWCMDFYKLYKLDSYDDFEHQWLQVISKYDMVMNKHVNGLHQIKHFWAPCYLRGYFFGGMTTTGRSESINAFIKRFVTAHISLVEFAKQIDLSIEDVEQTQSHDTMLETYRGSCLRTLSPLEEQAHSILTPYAFKLFQEEFGRATQYSVLKEKGGEFVLQYYKDKSSQMHKVSWDAIFNEKEMPLLDHPNLTDMENEIEQNHNDENDSDCFVNCPPISKTKGRPKQKRMKGGRELGKQTRTCGLCKRVGHYITTCPEKENVAFSNGANKRKKTSSMTEELNPVFCLKY
ncbi:hypothetical protein Vadar_019618 [Vaccinium darrowii]|uniref:Uncharacterized protein n=1 Tax=Vaccinium darrowii TaxID=229202 RepID=A0ACB7Y7W4_9ERIC|nr:hypothetical protein Vadar_019618 [Vaccinium darrowii]